MIEEIDGLPKENRVPKQHDSMPPTDSVEDLIKDLME